MFEARAIDVAPRQMAVLQETPLPADSQPPSHSQNGGPATSLKENGCFESDRVIKSGYVERRTRKTKVAYLKTPEDGKTFLLTWQRVQKWKMVYLVLRPNALSLYKNEKETKLRHQLCLSDLTAVAFLKDPKHKRENVFGLFSPSKNFHFQAPTTKDAQEWVDLIRRDARIEEEEEGLFLASPKAHSLSSNAMLALRLRKTGPDADALLLSSSPETCGAPKLSLATARRTSSNVEWSGLSGNELPSQSDLSDNENQQSYGASFENLAVQAPAESSSVSRGGFYAPRPPADRSISQWSVLDERDKNIKPNSAGNTDQDPDRIVWQGWLWMLRSKGGVRKWKDIWAVLRPRNLIVYKDELEYAARWLVQLSAVVDVVDIDPLGKNKQNCLQIITEEKSYRFCAHDEESLVQFVGAFKSLLAKRRGLEARSMPAS